MAASDDAASCPPPVLAVVAPLAPAATECITGTVVVDQHKKDRSVLHSYLRNGTIVKTPQLQLRVVGRIADGTWSSVFHVYEEDFSSCYALKLIPIEGTNVRSAFELSDMLKKLKHPNIVKNHCHFIHSYNDVNCFCCLMEYCGGRTLAGYIWDKAHMKLGISASRIQDFSIQISSALTYIHGKGLLHGDLRPGNILVTREQKLKLTGFGSPLWLERANHTPRSITGGCKTYAPPEWMGSEVPHRELRQWEKPLPSYDMWSFGCVLGELVTLTLLRNDRQHWGAALAADPAAMEGISREVAHAHDGLFADLYARLLEPNPDARLTAPQALRVLRSLQPPSCLDALCMPFSRVFATLH